VAEAEQKEPRFLFSASAFALLSRSGTVSKRRSNANHRVALQ